MKRGFRPKTTTSCRWMCEERDYSISGARRPPRPFCCLRDYDEFTNRHPPPPSLLVGLVPASRLPKVREQSDDANVSQWTVAHTDILALAGRVKVHSRYEYPATLIRKMTSVVWHRVRRMYSSAWSLRAVGGFVILPAYLEHISCSAGCQNLFACVYNHFVFSKPSISPNRFPAVITTTC